MLKKALALVAAAGVLALLNPSEARHREGFAAAFRAEHPVLTLFGADRVAPTLLTYRSYGVVSVGRVGEHVVTVGGAGMVHVRELDMEALGEEAGAQGKRGVKEFLDGLGDGGRTGTEAGER
jgi:hypothetical protein